MKIFISWSGHASHRVALVLRDWLPMVIQSVEPYVSSEDIDKGARWSTDIADELHASSYGLVCLTKDNVNAPWINFEAGALGKSIDKSRVSPLLYKLKRSEVTGPVLQFQSTVFEREDILKLLKSINTSCGQDALEDVRLEKSFDVWWPQLESKLSEIPDSVEETHKEVLEPKNDQFDQFSELLEEILELSRNNHRILRDPSSILPPDYLEHVLRKKHGRDFESEIFIHPRAIKDLVEVYREILKFISRSRQSLERNIEFTELSSLLMDLDSPVRYMSKEAGMRLPKDVLFNSDEF